MPFLSEVIAANTAIATLSPFAECTVFTSLWGRTLCHQQQCAAEQVHGNVSSTDLCERQLQLDNLLSRRVVQFQQAYPATAVESDSMLLFTSIIAQTVLLALYNSSESSGLTVTASQSMMEDMLGYQGRAQAAAKEITRLVDYHLNFSVFKVSTVNLSCRRS